MPELPPSIRNLHLSSKFSTLPVQRRNLLYLSGLPTVEPVMVPSLALHSLRSPSQPVRSLPLKMLIQPSSAAVVAETPRPRRHRAHSNRFMRGSFQKITGLTYVLYSLR